MMKESRASSEQARRTMLANRSKNTSPELAVRTLLHGRGLRYRTHFRPVPSMRRTADIVFTRRKIAVFIDGCFWHACPEHFIAPRSNSAYWGPKIAGNQRRDRETDEGLRVKGWVVLRFWEHQPPGEVADVIERVVATAQPPRER
ncbi:very short patch repair endonuclease [Paramicrobacterium sp. CJ85]|uniref:very short patch repair endonuclease n=1 Tax=Paramicrobacterium sp. CJ85 TaxID=3445355 RepID=UPI003F5FAA27